MDYEQKYKEALERAKVLIDKLESTHIKGFIYHIFPELKESKDDRIVRCLLNYFNHVRYNGLDLKGTDIDEVIAWLEKQDNKSVNIDIESMVSSYEQRLKNQGGTKNNPLVNMCLTSFRHGVENVMEELNLKKLEKQGEQKPTEDVKTLDANKVIEWLKNNGWCTVGGPKVEIAQINKFKKDFGLC